MELKNLLQILLRRKWILIQTFLVIFLTAVIGSYFLPPIYETSAKLLFELQPTSSSILEKVGVKELSSIIAPKLGQGDIETKISLAKVAPLLREVIFKLQLRDSEGNLLTPDKLLHSRFLSKLFPTPFISIKRDSNSNTVTITARSGNPDEAMFLANTLAELYIKWSEEDKKREIKNARLFVDTQIAKVKQDYDNALKQMMDFQKRHTTLNSDLEIKMAIQKMAELMKQKEDNIIDIKEVEAKIRTLRKQLQKKTASVPVSFVKESPQIQKLKQQLSELKLKLAELLTDRTEEHPQVIAVRRQIKELEEELKKEIETYQLSSPELDELERQLAALKAHLVEVNRDINRYVSFLKTIPERSSEEAKLKLALTTSQELYSSLLDYRNWLGVIEAMSFSDVRLVQPALKPYQPVSPKKTLNGIIGAFVGLILGIGMALLADFVDDTLKTPDELERYKELVLLGTVPQITGRLRLIAKTDTNDPVSEAYRTIRHSIKFASLDKPVKSILITSSGPDEGKTLTVANLGISFAQAGMNVLIVDADLRRPSLHKLFKKSNRVGLTTVITGECELEQAIIDVDIKGLNLLPSGPTPRDPALLLESEKLKQLIDTLCDKYDLVLLDCAPILIKSDAAILGHYVDGIIYLIAVGKVSRRGVTETINIFKKANVRILGVILNRYQQKKAYYSKKKAGWENV